MSMQQARNAALIVALTTLVAGEVAAQPFSAIGRSNARNAGRDYMGDVIREGIGTGYTISNLNNYVLNSSLGVSSAAGINTGLSGAARPIQSGSSFSAPLPSSKPFSNVRQDRTISPYLSLFNETLDGNFDTYNTLVRPQLQQQRLNDQLQRQSQQLNQRFQQLSAQPAFNPQGSQNAMATGHPTFFNNTLNYYPLRNQRRR